MAKNSEDTRRRLLEAATTEFAAYGIAGSRVDRIAAAAKCNKQAIYAYFGSKEALGEAVFDAIVQEAVESVPIDVYDLSGYAIRLFDRYQTHPQALRLAHWYQMEGKPLPSSAITATLKKVEAIRGAQKEGRVSTRFTPEILLLLILGLSWLGAPGSPEAQSGLIDRDVFRQSIKDAVDRLAEP